MDENLLSAQLFIREGLYPAPQHHITQHALYSSLAIAVAPGPVPMTLTYVCLQAWAVFVCS